MYRSRMRKVMGDVSSRRGRTLLVVLSIMIGVFGVTTMVSSTDILISQIEEDLKPEEIATAHIYVASPGKPISQEENYAAFETIAQLPGVEHVEGQAAYETAWQYADAPADVRFNESTVVTFSEPFEAVQLEPVSRVLEGRYPVTGQQEIVVERRFADKYDVAVGDTLLLNQTGSDKPAEWEVTGIVLHPYLVLSMAKQDVVPHAERIYANYEDAQQITGFTGLSAFHIRHDSFETAQSTQRELMQTISAGTPYIAVFPFLDNPDSNFILTQVGRVNQVLNMLGIVAMVVSGFLVTNVINTVVVEQKKQIGVMKSLGATRWDTVFIYGAMALVYGAVGTVLGVLLGAPVGSWMAQTFGSMAFTYIGEFSLSAIGIGIGVVMGLLVPVVAALIPAYNGTRVSIMDAMTDLGISSRWGQSWLARFVGALPIPINARQALSNILQKRSRLLLTGLTLTLAVAAFMGVTAVFASLGNTLSGFFDTYNFEIQVSTQQPQSFERFESILVENVDGIEQVSAGYAASVGIEGFESNNELTAGSNQLTATGIETGGSAFNFNLISGTGWSEDPEREGVVISQTVATGVDKEVGDPLTITVGGKAYEYEIIGIDQFPFDAIYFDWRELASISGFLDDVGEPLAGIFFVALENGDALTTQEIDARISVMRDAMSDEGIQAVYVNQPEVAAQQVQAISTFGLIFNLTSAVMAAVGAIGLLATLTMSVFERQKEIGVMRSIGADSGRITMQFLVEGILVGAIAWVVGVPLSFALANMLSNSLGFGTEFNFTYPPDVLIQGLIGIIIIATIASIWPSLSAARKTVSEILRYQ